MAKPLLDVFQRNSVCIQQASAAMPKIMKANFLQTIFLKEQIKMLRNKIGLDQFTHGIDIDIVQIIFTVAVTTHRTVNTLLCSEIQVAVYNIRTVLKQ